MSSTLKIVDGPIGSVTITWEGGESPFQLLRTGDFTTWEPVGEPTLARVKEVQKVWDHAFFRVQEQVKLLMVRDMSYTQGVKLVWQLPEL